MKKENEFAFIWDLPGKYLTIFGILQGMILPGFCLGMCYSVGMRKEALEVREKTMNPKTKNKKEENIETNYIASGDDRETGY